MSTDLCILQYSFHWNKVGVLFDKSPFSQLGGQLLETPYALVLAIKQELKNKLRMLSLPLSYYYYLLLRPPPPSQNCKVEKSSQEHNQPKTLTMYQSAVTENQWLIHFCSRSIRSSPDSTDSYLKGKVMKGKQGSKFILTYILSMLHF